MGGSALSLQPAALQCVGAPTSTTGGRIEIFIAKKTGLGSPVNPQWISNILLALYSFVPTSRPIILGLRELSRVPALVKNTEEVKELWKNRKLVCSIKAISVAAQIALSGLAVYSLFSNNLGKALILGCSVNIINEISQFIAREVKPNEGEWVPGRLRNLAIGRICTNALLIGGLVTSGPTAIKFTYGMLTANFTLSFYQLRGPLQSQNWPYLVDYLFKVVFSGYLLAKMPMAPALT